MDPIPLKIISVSKRNHTKDRRFWRVFYFFNGKGYLRTCFDLKPPQRQRLSVHDVIWAGNNVEPCFLELLPSAVLRFPNHFEAPNLWPEELLVVVQCLRDNTLNGPTFFNIPYAQVKKWMSFPTSDGRATRGATHAHSFRLNPVAAQQLRDYAEKYKITRTEALHRAIGYLAAPIRSNDSFSSDVEPASSQ